MKSRIGTILALFVVLASFANSFAAGTGSSSSSTKTSIKSDGGDLSGGGNAVGNQLFDFYENEGTREITLEKLVVFKAVVAPILNAVASKVPSFKYQLLKIAKTKKWYFESKPIGDNDCLNESMIKVDKVIVGCQDNYEVRIFQPWFDRNDVTPEHKGGLIMHELLVGFILQEKILDKSSEKNIRRMNRLLFTEKLPGEKEFQLILNNYNFGHFMTASEENVINVEIEQVKHSVCAGNDALSSFVDAFLSKSMDGRYSSSIRHGFYKKALYLKRLETYADDSEIRKFCEE
ncbi:MAG: hypothetical protein A2381_13735 [Bdellovibrionales bacterium RIFOXYB1_FULL_37_110]|nr:MAG: hypothetical protein A2417_05370 [Bdellovibrionales bacterium RIFOXYC1_FULL_37_79]OFZ56922.1 MAG: hypothetical protein A2381_13735 [Bdellovibrionales bacterium RIFOXYB1_FULL_37_110]OFZ62009.1 MAG: hypothetical protein A2577_19205 [Bdellovibrionales bacterium RIFOXYD1_FULL_36_51]OFZ63971.1 MAG: hypothetical protein A2328_07900 [Bdellovibrionales bacterium RIFOXYB2_FULL_36_6]